MTRVPLIIYLFILRPVSTAQSLIRNYYKSFTRGVFTTNSPWAKPQRGNSQPYRQRAAASQPKRHNQNTRRDQTRATSKHDSSNPTRPNPTPRTRRCRLLFPAGINWENKGDTGSILGVHRGGQQPDAPALPPTLRPLRPLPSNDGKASAPARCAGRPASSAAMVRPFRRRHSRPAARETSR